MKRYISAITLAICSLFNVTKPMENLPFEMKKAIIVNSLQDHSIDIEAIIESLIVLTRTNKEFYAVVYDIPLAQLFLDLGQLVARDNIFAVFDFIKQHPQLLQYQNLAQYLHNKFNYLSANTIKYGLYLLDPINAEAFKQTLGKSINQSFHGAIQNNNIDDAFPLMVLGANVDYVSNALYTPLMFAIGIKNFQLVKLLLDAGADVNFKAPSGTALLKAVSDNNLKLVKELLEHHAKVNIDHTEPFYNSFPIVAALRKNKDMIDLLLQHDADMSKEFFERRKREILNDSRLSQERKDGYLDALDFLNKYISSLRAGFLSRRARFESRGLGGL